VRLRPPNGNIPYLFELGVPVQPVVCPYDVDIQQKIPLSPERDMVKDSFLQDIYAEVLNRVIGGLPETAAADTWVKLGMTDSRCSDETVSKIKDKRYGEEAVLWSSDTAANERALSAGWDIIKPRTLSSEELARFEAVGTRHSSEVFDLTPVAAKDVDPTEAMLRIGELARLMAKELTGQDIGVRFYSLFGGAESASYCMGTIAFNVARLGKKWFEQGICPDTVGLILHELAHGLGHDANYEHGNGYQWAALRLAGKAVILARDKPEIFKQAA
jgi:hypothetical protein